jgi:hypothetical protein
MIVRSLATPVATIRAYRRTGGAVVTVEREGQPPHRYLVSLRRYHALRQWTAFGTHPWRSSSARLRSSLTAYLWAKEVTTQTAA